MIFKDRVAGGERLAVVLEKDVNIKRRLPDRVVVVSLIRGGVVVGDIIAKKLKVKHLILPSIKIPAFEDPELALGAVCFDQIFIDREVLKLLPASDSHLKQQIIIAKERFKSYVIKFSINEGFYKRIPKNSLIVLVDDGIATGATVHAALLYLKSKVYGLESKIYLACPVSPKNFNTAGFDKVIILHYDAEFLAVSRFYEYFPQVDDGEVNNITNFQQPVSTQ